jgi:hypothetical protein
MFTALFWKDLVERSLSTAAQVLLGIFTADQFDVLSVDWKGVLTAVVTAVVVVVLKAVVAANISGTVSPASLAKDDRGV